MGEFFQKLFATDFMAHVYCLRLPGVIRLHVGSDLLIAGSYFVIPLALVSLVRRRRDLAFSWIFLLFATFILACGTTHVLNVWTLWHPVYRFEGLVKALTAVASVLTAALLFRLLPKAVLLPSAAQLHEEIERRSAAQEAAQRANAELELLVEARTRDLVEANARLKESEERFRAAAEAATDIIWTNSADGRMRGEQPSWALFTGQTFDEYQDYGWSQKVHPDDAQPTIDEWERVVTARTRFAFEHRVLRTDGEWRLCKISAVPVLRLDGSIREWVGTHTDITEQRRAEEEARLAQRTAEDANRAKSAFLASMSHELRTPLNAIIGYSELLEDELREAGFATYVPDLVKVRNSGRHLLELINDLLDLRKIEEGRMELQIDSVSVPELVRDAVDTALPLLQQRGNHIDVEIEPSLPNMHSDSGKIRQSLLNLLSNAAKFTQDGQVTMRAFAEADDVVFQVIDTGIGIESEKLLRVFEPFRQADLSISRLYGGSGLGLALTRRFCRLMGGDVTLLSTPGQGSTFTIRLPRVLEQQEATPTPETMRV